MMALICSWLGPGLFIPGEGTVVDFTVFSERAEKRVAASMADPSHVFINPSFSLADGEENKVVQYSKRADVCLD